MSTTGPPRLTPFVSPLAPEIHRFLQFQRAAGYRYWEEARALQGLDRFLADHLAPDDPVITPDLVRAYLARRGTESETTRGHRLSLLRQLCRFLALTEPRTTIPAPRCLGIQRRLFVPRVLTRAEGRRFLHACAAYPAGRGSPLRGVVHGTALILLYLTGLRAGEAVHLTVGDVDLARGVLHIRGAKFGKARLVPLAADLTARLARCHAAVEQALGPRGPDAPFFPGPTGQPCGIDVVRYSFRKLLAAAGIPRRRGDRGPRLHDLRHSFASLRLLLWCEQEADLGAQLPLLATYLGHVGLTSSQRYLQLTADLLGEVTRRYQARFGVPHHRREDPMTAPDLATLVTTFFVPHLAAERNVSPHTASAYRDALKLLLRFAAGFHGRPVARLTLDALSPEAILAFLDHLETARHNAVRTRNARLAAIHAFFRFVLDREPTLAALCHRVLALPLKKTLRPRLGALSAAEVGHLLAQIERGSPAGERDYLLLALLYDTGARIQELLDVTPRDFRLAIPAYVRLVGKGRRERLCPLLPQSAHLVTRFLQQQGRALDDGQPLLRNRGGARLTRHGARYLLRKYLAQAGASMPSLTRPGISPHTLRHAKGLHLLEAGVPLVTIKDFLGHADVRSTEMYVEATLEMKRTALDQAGSPCRPGRGRPRLAPDLLAWLEAL